ncbi:MAG: transketolase [Myxococcales bacterium]|nr:transketolase [Myxococcales bacterium]
MISYQDTLAALCAADPRVVVMTAENRAAIRGLPERLGPRFIDVGIAEQTMIGMAAGLALRGRIPICHALATFITLRAFEFIRTDLGIAGLPALLVGGVPGLLSEANGPTHQAIEDIALMRGIPGMQVFCPADGAELVAALPVLLASGKPCYIRYFDGPAAVEHQPFAIGRAEVLSDGEDVGLITTGYLLREAEVAQQTLSQRGRSTRLVNLRMPVPLDEEAVIETARRCELLVTLEDHFVTGGLYSLVCECLIRHGVMVPVHPIGFEQRWFTPGLLADVLRAEGLTGAQIASRCTTALDVMAARRAPAAPPSPPTFIA